MALSPGGDSLALGGFDGTVTLFDTETLERIGVHHAPGPVWTLEFGPRNSLAVTANASPDLSNGSVEIVDAGTARARVSIALGSHPAGRACPTSPTPATRRTGGA